MHNSKITIVLTLKDRAEFTWRWMSYMEDSKCKYPILIADGGSNPEIELNLGNYSNYPSLTYRYIKYPYDSNVDAFFDKLYSVVSLVETEYLIFADNDDFYLHESIEQCLSFLENNDEYVSCCGKRVFLKLYSKSGTVLSATNGYYSTLTTYEDNRRSIEQESPMERIEYFFHNVDKDSLWMKHYSVTKSDVLKESLGLLKEKKFHDLNSFELYLNARTLYAGKHKELNCLYYVRQEATSQATKDLNLHSNLIERFLLGMGINDFFEAVPFIGKQLTFEEEFKIKSYFIQWLILHGSSIYAGKDSKCRSLIKRTLFDVLNFKVSYYLIVCFFSLFNVARKRKVYYVSIPRLSKYIISR